MNRLTLWLIDSVDEMQRPGFRKNEHRKWVVFVVLILVFLGVLGVKGLLW